VSRLKGADGGTPPAARRRDSAPGHGHGLAAEDAEAALLNALAQHAEEELLLERELLDALAPLKVLVAASSGISSSLFKGISSSLFRGISSSLLRY
jgi:hypothetical protein